MVTYAVLRYATPIFRRATVTPPAVTPAGRRRGRPVQIMVTTRVFWFTLRVTILYDPPEQPMPVRLALGRPAEQAMPLRVGLSVPAAVAMRVSLDLAAAGTADTPVRARLHAGASIRINVSLGLVATIERPFHVRPKRCILIDPATLAILLT